MRTLNEILQELTEINDFILRGLPDNNITLMMQVGSTLTTYLASTAAMVAESGKYFNQAKVRAYHSLAISSVANAKYYSASLAKDYIASRCCEEGYIYEFSQRMNAAVTHAADMVRTCISAEKQLMANVNIGGHGNY